MEVLYLVRGATLKCMFGSKEGKLNLPESHGSYILNQPIICEEDCKPFINIPSFGICKLTNMPCIPVILGKWLCAHKQTQITISPVTATPSAVVAQAAITATLPAANTTPPAINTKPAVTTDSALFCGFGGLILPQDSGQEEILQLLANFPKEELLNLLMGLKSGSLYSKDPVNLSTGNFVYEKEDISIMGTYPLSFKRTYNSLDKRKGVFGEHWTHSYELFLIDKGDYLIILVEDGCIETYYKEAENNFVSLQGIFNTLEKISGEYILTTIEQIKYIFNQKGECTKKIDNNHNITYYNYQENKLVSVINKTGKLFFHYDIQGHLISILDHAERSINYIYDTEGLLIGVQNPQGYFYYYEYNEDKRLVKTVTPSKTITVENQYDELGRIIKQTFTDGGIMLYDYDDSNQRIIVKEQNGKQIKYYKDKKFRNIKTVYQDGYEVMEYNNKNLQTYFRDKNGNEYHYEYNESGKMIKQINPLGYEATIKYNKNGLPTKIVAYDDSCIQYYYDQKGNMIEEINPLGYKAFCQYDQNGLPQSIFFPDNYNLQFLFDQKGNIIKIIDSYNSTTEYIYNELNYVIESIDGNKNKTYYEYNVFGDIIKVINAAGYEKLYEYDKNRKITKIIDFDGSVTLQEYNELGLPNKIIDAAGYKTDFKYDLMWNLQEKIQANGAKTIFIYNKLNQLEKVIDAMGAVFVYKYDRNGNVIKEIRPGGREYKYEYNAVNKRIKIEEPDGIKTKIEYDPMGRITSITNARDSKMTIEYNAMGLKTKEIDILGNETCYFYNELGFITKMIESLGRTTCYEYLPGGWCSKVIYPNGTYITYEYDQNYNVIKQENQAGYFIFYTYNCLNQIITVCDSDGVEFKYIYDATGNVTSTTDSNGNITKYWYSPIGQLIRVEDAMGSECTYEYDELGNLIILNKEKTFEQKCKEIEKMNVEQKKKNVIFYKRNQIGQVIGIKDALGNTEKFSYYESGWLKEKIDKEGNKTSYVYTLTGNIEKVTYADGESVKFHYNALRQLVMIEDWLGLTKIEPDLLGRPNKVTDYEGREILYEWNPIGRLKQITYPDQTKANYEYDLCGRLSRLIEGTKVIQYDYDKNGFLKSMKLPNGIVSTYQYNNKGNLLKLEHNCQNEWLDSYQYQYDKMGNKIRVNKNRKGLREESGNYLYQYDALNRLIKVSKDEKKITRYRYDAFGNRNYLKHLDKEIVYHYNINNQLLQTKERENITEYEYDKRGNLIKILKNRELILACEYNAKNQLSKAYNPNGLSAIYNYNGLGYRVKKQLGSIEKQNKMATILIDPTYQPYIGKISGKFQLQKQVNYIVDLTKEYNNLLMTEENGIKQCFLWDRELVAINKEGKTGYYCQDELGSPIRLVWNTGQEAVYEYDEFGKDVYSNLKNQQPFGYTGYQREEEIPFYFAQARYYDPFNGRFIQEDDDKGILENIQTLNSYIYCIENPFIYVDLLGHKPTWKEIKDGIADFGDKTYKVVSTIGGGVVGAASVVGGGGVIVGSIMGAPASFGATVGGVAIGAGGIAHGANSVYNSAQDMNYIINGEWDKVGTKNFLKDEVYTPLGGAIGNFLGGEKEKKIGEDIGKGAYDIFDIILCTSSINDGFKALNNHEYTNIKVPLYEDGGIKDRTITLDLREQMSEFQKIFTRFNIYVNTKVAFGDDIPPLIAEEYPAIFQSMMSLMFPQKIGAPILGINMLLK